MSSIESLTGEPLSAVAFVQDYVEFHFDGKIVRALTNPVVTVGSATRRFPAPGSRDAFCSLIGQVLERVYVEESRKIEMQFSGGAVIDVPLSASERVGPEAAHFVPGKNQPIQVW